jgi:acetyl esterase/lipase
MKLLALLLLASIAAAPAQNRNPRHLEGIDLKRDLAYAGTDNPRQKLDLLLPKKEIRKGDKLPLVVFIHGGAWRKGDKRGGVGRVLPYVRTGKYAGATLGYRLTDEAHWPAQIHDVKAAIRWLRGNAGEYGFDPEKIGIFGSSAGGHLVGMLGTSGGVKALEGDLGEHDDQSSRVTCVGNYFGPSELLTMGDHPSRMDHDAPDSPESKLVGGTLQETKDVARQASPITHVSKDDPPMLHIHGTDDPLVPYPQSVAFDKALKAAGCDSELLTVKGGGHGGFRNPEIDRRLADFFAKHLLGEDLKVQGGEVPAAAP